ncbi:hypothetical protein HO133_005088 [Letharia lupina]|uniref:VanZ-like domain-containing protein n=1 Tax=Letharia lupina TaxID=560253 RepID=A0A8H6C9M2_9LECA|nr:uncharacterized protein HO133_005088 [Letharia lupina]KAF6219263.1 hypothetical protein HO133_005088 [Letharia lupina]
MRVRINFACAFVLVLLGAAYLGLGSTQIPQVNDKVLHFLTFFLLTTAFYWILDTTRRRVLNFTLLVVTFGLGLGSEALQGLLPNGRQFDPLDIAANVVGSLLALGLCTLYHKRMLDRRRRAKGYSTVPQDGEGQDLELGGQETGTVEEDARESSPNGEGRLTPSSGAEEGIEGSK